MRDRRDQLVECLSGLSLAVGCVERVCLRGAQAVDEPADDDGHCEKESKIDRIADARDRRLPHRFSEENVIAYSPGDRRDDRGTATAPDREPDDEHDHEMFEHECRQRELRAGKDGDQRKPDADGVA